MSCMLGFVFCLLAVSTDAERNPNLALVKTFFTGVHPVGINLGAFVVDVQALTVNLRGCSVDGIPAFLSAHGSVFLENTIFENAGAPIPQEDLQPDIYEDTEYRSQVRITTGSVTLLRCKFTSIQRPQSDGSAIWASNDNGNTPSMLNLTETNFTDCTGNWGIVFSKALRFVIDGCTIERCTGTNSIMHYEDAMSDEQKQLVTVSGCSFVEPSVTKLNSQSGGSGLVFRGIVKLEFIDCLFSKNKQAPSGGGVYGDWIASLTHLTISGCEFRDLTTKREQTEGASAQMKNGGCFLINHQITFTATDCIFANIACFNGGVLYLEEGTPGVQEVVFQGCTITGIEARGGGIAWLQANTPTKFVMYDTTVDSLRVENAWLEVRMGQNGVCIFDNNTISNMHAGSGYDSLIIFRDISNTSIVICDCTFTTTVATNFVVGLLQESTQSFTVKNCRFTDVQTTHGLNARSENSFVQQVSLDNCVLDTLKVIGGQLIRGSNIELLNCDLQTPTVTATSGVLFNVEEGRTLSVTTCTLTDVKQGVKMFAVSGTDVTVTLKTLNLNDCTVPLGSFSGCSSLTIDNLQMRDCQQQSLAVASSEFTLKGSTIPGLSMNIQATTITISGMDLPQSEATVTLAGTGTLSELQVSIGLTISGGKFTFKDCCFHSAPTGPYITCKSPEGTSISFEEPICFDKSKEESLQIGEIQEDSVEEMFGCENCKPVEPATDVSSVLDDETTQVDDSEQYTSEVDSSVVDDSSAVGESDDIPDDKDTTTSDGDNTTNSKLPPGAIAGIAVAAILVVVAVVVVIVLFVLRRKKKSNDFDDDDNEMFDEDSSVTTETLETTAVMGEDPQVSNPLFSHMEGDEDFSSVFEETKDDL